MRREHSVRGPAPAGRRLVLEPLERRMLLSGNVTVFVSGVDLIIQGDAGDNSVSVTQDSLEFADQFQVTGLDGTTINNGVDPHIFQGVFGDVQFAMGDGDDSVQVEGSVVAGDLLCDGGDGDNTLSVDPSAVLGDLVVINGQGFDRTTLQDVVVGGSVLVRNGDGGSLVTFVSVSGTTTVDGDLVIRNGDGVDAQDLSDFEVDGNVIIDNGDGGISPAGVSVAAVPVTGSITQMLDGDVGGSVSIKNRAGVDEQLITATTIGGNVQIDNGNGHSQDVVPASDGLGALFDSETAFLDSAVEGNLSIKNKDGLDSQAFDELSVGGNLSINNGSGGSLVNFAPTLDTVTIGGSLTIKNKDGSDEVQLSALQVGGNVTIDNGTGGSEVVGGDADPDTVGGNVSIKDRTDLGVGLSNFEVWGNLSIAGGAEGGQAMLIHCHTHGNLSFKGVGATDELGLVSVEINGNTTVRDGKGDFTFQALTNVETNLLDGGLSVRNQGGALTVAIDQTDIGGRLSIGTKNAGSMIDLTAIQLGPVGGRLTVKTGAGVDALTLADSQLGGQTSVDTGAGDDTVSATSDTFGASVGIKAGDGENDVVTLDSVSTNSTTSLDGGKGLNDALTITGGTFAFAPAYVNFENVTVT